MNLPTKLILIIGLLLMVGCATEEGKQFNQCAIDCMKNQDYHYNKLCSRPFGGYGECSFFDSNAYEHAKQTCYMECSK